MDSARAVLSCRPMKTRRPVVLSLLSVLAMTGSASADDGTTSTTTSPVGAAGAALGIDEASTSAVLSLEERSDPEDRRGLSGLIPSYLWDGGALPFIWGTMAARIAMDRWVPARSSPLGFGDEGGAAVAGWENPGWAVTATGGAVGLAMALGDNDSRWFHVKGLAQTLSTGAMVVGGLKLAVARQRPDWSGDASNGFGGGNRSFPSGHSTQAFEIATYAALYLRYHGFERFRPQGTFRWWEGVAYGGIFTGAATSPT
jgi:membrane-associated phospholipid phosphatase